MRALESAEQRLARSVDEVNALNVYPVPDGDTGTNMLHTVRSALAHARKAPPTPGEIAAAAAHGALMGARGNSGVILSQIVRGMKDAFAGKDEIAGEDLCRAYALAREHAYTAVNAPADGTILTALAEMAEAVGHGRADAKEALRVAVEAGVAAVERTREANPMNRAAGVVDAGARGLWLLMDGALAAVEGREVAAPDPSAPRAAPVTVAAHELPADVASWAGAYDVQFLVAGPSRPVADLRAEMLEYGADCVLVVGDETAVKVHVHTRHPDQIIRIGMSAGRIADLVLEDLEAMAAAHARATGIDVEAPPVPGADLPTKERTPCGVVAVVPGEGFERIVRSLGGTPLRGGATMNPSTEELLGAIRAANADHVVVLPNDRNVIAAAQQAARMAGQPVTVVPSRTVAQGMTALVQFEADGDGAEVARAMEESARGARSIELTRAIRASNVDGERVKEGEAIALLDGRLAAHGDDEIDVLGRAAARIGSDVELLTLYVGDGVAPDRAEHARAKLREVCAGAEVEVVDGGQPHYPFLVAAE